LLRSVLIVEFSHRRWQVEHLPLPPLANESVTCLLQAIVAPETMELPRFRRFVRCLFGHPRTLVDLPRLVQVIGALRISCWCVFSVCFSFPCFSSHSQSAVSSASMFLTPILALSAASSDGPQPKSPFTLSDSKCRDLAHSLQHLLGQVQQSSRRTLFPVSPALCAEPVSSAASARNGEVHAHLPCSGSDRPRTARKRTVLRGSQLASHRALPPRNHSTSGQQSSRLAAFRKTLCESARHASARSPEPRSRMFRLW
jgi:hypothetical protein